MNAIGQQETPGHGSRKFTSVRFGASADTSDIVLLLVTTLALMGAAAGIAVGFPCALEIVATQASAHAAVSSDPQTGNARARPPEEIEEEVAPFVADDIRVEGLMHASAGTAGAADRSAPEASGANC